MTGAEALRRFEQRLIPLRTPAQADAEWERYEREVLPAADPSNLAHKIIGRPLIQQGYDAGFAAAMDLARKALAEVQTEALRDG